MPKQSGPLTVPSRDLQEFNRRIGSRVQRALELDSSRHLHCEKYEPVQGQRTLAYGLKDANKDLRVANKRRLQNYAYPILQRRESAILLSIAYDWAVMTNRYRFVGAQFVVYLLNGAAARNLDPASAQQTMRLEWQGRSGNGTFEAATAGHPHWQIDAIPGGQETGFAPSAVVSMDQLAVTQTRPSTSWLSHVHLASAAGGWSQNEGWSGDEDDCDVHANSPETLAALMAWTTSASRYLLQQLRSALP